MARGVRKSALEKLGDELSEVRDSIIRYEESLVTMREKEAELLGRIELEEYKSITALLDEQGMSLEDLKVMIQSRNESD